MARSEKNVSMTSNGCAQSEQTAGHEGDSRKLAGSIGAAGGRESGSGGDTGSCRSVGIEFPLCETSRLETWMARPCNERQGIVQLHACHVKRFYYS